MTVNSVISDVNYPFDPETAPIDEEFFYASPHSLLFRIRKDGKYFFKKKTALKGERGKRILRREYEISLGCDHPNIVHIYEYSKDEKGDFAILMEYIDGMTLGEYLSANPSFKERKRIFFELLDAIEALHSARIVHNDLKPENILIARNGNRLKLIDFGLCDDDAHYKIKTPGYSKSYAAPELIALKKSDIRSDIYSIGILMRQIFGKRYPTIVRRCLAQQPSKRFQNVRSLKKCFTKTKYIKIFILTALISLPFLMVLFSYFQSIERKTEKLSEKIRVQEEIIYSRDNEIETLKENYAVLKDSIKTARTIEIEKEENKKRFIESFLAQLDNLKRQACDSIRQCTTIADAGVFSKNYLMLGRQLYDETEKTINGEDLSPILHSIMQNHFEKSYEEFGNIWKDYPPR